jgi:hypothetical protein
MKKIQTLGLALAALFVFSAMLAATASAEITLLAEWLAAGAAITTALASATTGEILLEDTKVPLIGKVAVVCSGILDGTVNANGVDEITKVLTLAGVETGTPLVAGTGLLCTTQTACENNADIEVWPLGLPWPTLLFKMESGAFLDLVAKSGYEVACLVLGAVSDECTSTDTELLVQNGATGAETPSGSKAEPLANCSQGGAGAGNNETVGKALITLTEGGELTVS